VSEEKSHQRLSLEALREWERLGYGMFIHFGMSTFDGVECSPGTAPPSEFRPEKLDVRGWVRLAREAGMRYAVLTAKHMSGFCLWPSRWTDYHVGNSPVPVDVVGEFVAACRAEGIVPGLFYTSWDNHHKFGSRDHNELGWGRGYVTPRYEEFQNRQISELLERHPDLGEFWIDIPSMLDRGYREELYQRVASLAPQCKILLNRGLNIGLSVDPFDAWPTDLFAVERITPNSFGWNPWQTVEGKLYYIPCETCETIGMEWFYTEGDSARSLEELKGLFYITRCRNSNALFNIGPDRTGRVPGWQRDALLRLRDSIIEDMTRRDPENPGSVERLADFVPKLSLRAQKSAGVRD